MTPSRHYKLLDQATQEINDLVDVRRKLEAEIERLREELLERKRIYREQQEKSCPKT